MNISKSKSEIVKSHYFLYKTALLNEISGASLGDKQWIFTEFWYDFHSLKFRVISENDLITFFPCFTFKPKTG